MSDEWVGQIRIGTGRRIGMDVLLSALELAFPGRAKEAGATLVRYGTEAHEREPERVRLAAVELSGGDIEELNSLIEVAKQDWRDILMWAEQKRKGTNRS